MGRGKTQRRGLRTGTPAICQRHKQKREFGTSGSSLDYAVIDCAIYFKKEKGGGQQSFWDAGPPRHSRRCERVETPFMHLL